MGSEMCIRDRSGRGGEVGGGDEDAPGRAVGVEAPGKVPDLGFSYLPSPAFCLDVQSVESEGVLVDDAVYASVSCASYVATSSVAHVFEEVEDGALEAVGWEVYQCVEDVVCLRSE